VRYVTVEMRPTGESFHPLSEELRTEPSITRVGIHQIEQLDDGTVLMEGEVRGDLDRLREILAASEHVLDHAVFGENEGFSYSRFEPNDLVDFLIQRRHETEFMVEWPVTYTDDGAQRITLIGPQEAFARADPTGPEGVEMEIVEMGQHDPDEGRLSSALTARQQEVLDVALDLGYYEDPRQSTHEDVAAELDCSAATVGEHLRKIERQVFTALRA
jgi:hypothetical protein